MSVDSVVASVAAVVAIVAMVLAAWQVAIARRQLADARLDRANAQAQLAAMQDEFEKGRLHREAAKLVENRATVAAVVTQAENVAKNIVELHELEVVDHAFSLALVRGFSKGLGAVDDHSLARRIEHLRATVDTLYDGYRQRHAAAVTLAIAPEDKQLLAELSAEIDALLELSQRPLARFRSYRNKAAWKEVRAAKARVNACVGKLRDRHQSAAPSQATPATDAV